ncbi:B12-binding domain-containing radical SAM protein [Paenibacillus borealis]|uniref:B12-binding domain-containing protein n=1 Tax=Paenibacillus borealis TaxID=160799 RepID=A0A089LCV3_PAEBO|nr:radical SAM protein [Paenibacillus borealis]AIQ56958.1 hypothetical protein PBOR_08460 [Paenibacillus borealis]
MKVLLLSIQGKGNEIIEEPGLGSLAASVGAEGHEVKVKRFAYELDYEQYLKEFNPDIIGITTYDRYFHHQVEYAKKLKQILPSVVISMGGYTATYHYMDIMKEYEFVDYIIIGEGEISFTQLIKSIENKSSTKDIKGLCYRYHSEIIVNEGCSVVDNLDELPFTNRDMLLEQKNNLVNITTTRGCSSTCTFCCSNNFWRNGERRRFFRKMSATRVVDEIEYLKDKYNKNRFVFNDNSYEDSGMNRQIEVANELMKRNIKIGYNVNYRVNFYKKASEEFMSLLISSGLCSVFLGVESGNDKDLILYNKRTTTDDCFNAVRFFSQFEDLALMIGFINFSPYSSVETLQENVIFLREIGYACDLSNFSSCLIPFKGTSLYEKIESDGLLIKGPHIGMNSFKFENDQVESVYKYLDHVVKTNKILKQSSYLCGVFPTILVFLMRDAKNNNDTTAMEIISNANVEMEKLKSELNLKISEWMLELLETDKLDTKADAITEKYLIHQNISSIYSDLMAARNNLYKNLCRHDPYYLSRF